MKVTVYYPKFKKKEFYFYPLYPVQNIIGKIVIQWKILSLRRKLKKLNWNLDRVWDMTRFCGCLDVAVEKLKFEITNDYRLYPAARKLILDGYDRDWK